MHQEVRDVEAFRTLMAGFWNSSEDGKPWATTALVMLHNIVTSTIPKRFDAQRHRYYCVAEVIEKLERSAVLQASSTRLNASVLQPFGQVNATAAFCESCQPCQVLRVLPSAAGECADRVENCTEEQV